MTISSRHKHQHHRPDRNLSTWLCTGKFFAPASLSGKLLQEVWLIQDSFPQC